MNYIKIISNSTSGTDTLSNTGQDVRYIHDAGLTVTKTIVFPANPVDGQMVSIGACTAIVTITLNSSATIKNNIVSMAAGSTKTWMYDSVSGNWYLI